MIYTLAFKEKNRILWVVSFCLKSQTYIMSVERIISLYEDAQYRDSFLETLKSFKFWINSNTLVYLIKNIITRDWFFVRDKKQLKLLILYYFYLLWEVSFTNDYKILFRKDKLHINMKFILQLETLDLNNFKQFFDLGKNEVFLTRIIDTTLPESSLNQRNDVVRVWTLIDFFIVFLHENFELYSLEWEYFPLFKWLINEVQEEQNH